MNKWIENHHTRQVILVIPVSSGGTTIAIKARPLDSMIEYIIPIHIIHQLGTIIYG